MRDATVVEIKHFVVRLKLRMFFDLAHVAQIQHVALLTFENQVLHADFYEFVFHVFFFKMLRFEVVTTQVIVDFGYLLFLRA